MSHDVMTGPPPTLEQIKSAFDGLEQAVTRPAIPLHLVEDDGSSGRVQRPEPAPAAGAADPAPVSAVQPLPPGEALAMVEELLAEALERGIMPVLDEQEKQQPPGSQGAANAQAVMWAARSLLTGMRADIQRIRHPSILVAGTRHPIAPRQR